MDQLRLTSFTEDWDYVKSLPVWQAALGVASLVIFVLYVWLKRPYLFPPGPPVLPFIGCWYLASRMVGRAHTSLTAYMWTLRLQYGGVFSLAWYNRLLVVLSDYESMREGLIKQGQDFAGRPHSFRSGNISSSQYGLLNSPYTESWKQQRHAFVTLSRHLCTANQAAILEEMKHLTRVLSAQRSRPLDPRDVIRNAVINMTSLNLFGERHDYDTDEFRHMKQITADGFQGLSIEGATGGLFSCLPWWRRTLRERLKMQTRLTEFIRSKLEKHVTVEAKGQQRCLVDGYREMVKSGVMKDALSVIIQDVYLVGQQAVTSTLSWLVYYLAANPHVQAAVHDEMLRVVGRDKTPGTQHRDDMPYACAVLSETLRLSCALPLAVTHVTNRETTVRGYKIPRGCKVVVCLWSVLRDPSRWPEPNRFNPKRFLDDAGQLQKVEAFIPFGLGRRACPAEQYTENQLFLFMTSLVGDFHIRLAQENTLSDVEGISSTTYHPSEFEVCFTRRQ